MSTKKGNRKRASAPGTPVWFTEKAWLKYFFDGARFPLRGEEYQCELYGTIDERGIVVHEVLEHSTRPAMRRAIIADLRRRHLVLLGESRKLATDFCTPQRRSHPYVFLLARRLDGHTTIACASVQDSRVITHPMHVLRDAAGSAPARLATFKRRSR